MCFSSVLHNMFLMSMAPCSLFVLKVLLNTNKPNQPNKSFCSECKTSDTNL